MKRNYINPEITVIRLTENLMDTYNMSVYEPSVGFNDVLGKSNDIYDDEDDYNDDTSGMIFPLWED